MPLIRPLLTGLLMLPFLLAGRNADAAVSVGTTVYTFTGTPNAVTVTAPQGLSKRVRLEMQITARDYVFSFPISIVNYTLFVTSDTGTTVPTWASVTPTTGTIRTPATVPVTVNLDLSTHPVGTYQVRLRAKVTDTDARNQEVCTLNVHVLEPPATGFASEQPVRLHSTGGYWQELLHNYDTGTTRLSAVFNTSQDVNISVPDEQWVGSFHYDYTTARFTSVLILSALNR